MAREVDGQLYTISATPAGDQLTVTRYSGEFGTFEVGSDDAKADNLGVNAWLFSKNNILFTIGDAATPYSDKHERRTRLPVGDYRPLQLSVQYGKLRVRLSPNRYSEDGDERSEKAPVHSIAIREDKPHVFKFAEAPSVLFISPEAGETFKPGAKIDIGAMLIDRSRDLMISDIQDTSRKERELKIPGEDGKFIKYAIYASLDPVVSITNAAGKEVASGKMPFG
jgi:hypothetical protein